MIPSQSRRESAAKWHKDNRLEKSRETESAVEHGSLTHPDRTTKPQTRTLVSTDQSNGNELSTVTKGTQLMKELFGVNTNTRISK